MDDADRAAIEAEREADRLMRNRAAQRLASPPSEYCRECGEVLNAVRKEYGLCITCAKAKELRQSQIAA